MTNGLHRTATAALADSDRRPMKPVFFNLATRLYFVGDRLDAPATGPGYWHELTYRELAIASAMENR